MTPHPTPPDFDLDQTRLSRVFFSLRGNTALNPIVMTDYKDPLYLFGVSNPHHVMRYRTSNPPIP